MSLWPEGLVGLCKPPNLDCTQPQPRLHPGPQTRLLIAPPPPAWPESSLASELSEIGSLPHPTLRAEKETKVKIEKITEIRDLTTQIMNIKR